jgi:YD repeat-containing protein
VPTIVPAAGVFTSVAAGDTHSAAIKNDGTVYTWGTGTGFSNRTAPTLVVGLTNTVAISAKGNQTLALKNDGTVWTVGSTATQVAGLSDISAIAAGGTAIAVFGVALRSDGTVWTWGNNSNGQLGDGTTVTRTTPAPLQLPPGTKGVAITASTSPCRTTVVLDNGVVMNWGAEPSGSGNTSVTGIPTKLDVLGGGVNSVILNSDHSAALLQDGSAWLWGGNGYGQLGNNTTVASAPPVQVSGAYKDIVTNSSHTLALNQEGTVWAWGYNAYGQLGTGTTTNSSVPVQVTGLPAISKIYSSQYHSYAVAVDGSVWAWGYNYYGELGNGTTANSSVPVQVSGLSGVSSLYPTNSYCVYALKSDGSVWAWGDNYYGELGNGTTTSSSVPVQVSGLSGVSTLYTSGSKAFALKNDGTVWAWGANSLYGEMGNGDITTANITAPVQASGLSGVVMLKTDFLSVYALKNDGTVWTWGYNAYGQLGNGTTANGPAPAQVTGIVGIASIAASNYGLLALKNDGSVWAWGYNVYGQLGNGTTTNSSVPAQVIGLSNAASILNDSYTSYARKTDGSVWSWGYNASGQLGNGTTTSSSLPLQAFGLNDVASLFAAANMVVAVKHDGSAYKWGVQPTTTVIGSQAAAINLNLGSDAPPQILSFSLPNYTGTSVVPVTLSAVDDVGVVSYCVSDRATIFSCSWSATPPPSFTFNAITAVAGASVPVTLYAWVKDTAGNISLPVSTSGIIDFTPPSVTLSIPMTSVSDTVPVNLSAIDNSGTIGGYCLSEINDSAGCSWSATVPTTFTFSNVPIGFATNRVLFAFARDGVGNVSRSVSAIIVITIPDTFPPSVSIVTPKAGTNAQWLWEISGTSSDIGAGVGKVELQIFNGIRYISKTGLFSSIPEWVTACQAPIDCRTWTLDTSNYYMNFVDATNTITARATDMAGNVSDVAVSSFTQGAGTGNQPPVINQGNIVSVAMSTNRVPNAFKLILTGYDPDGDPITWSISSQGSHGTATASGSNTVVTVNYVPVTDFTGSDSFVVQLSDGKVSTLITVNVTVSDPQRVVLLLHKSSAAAGTVTSKPAGIFCDSTCGDTGGSFIEGTSVTFSEVPAMGYYFESWSNCDQENGSDCTVNASISHPITKAIFSPQSVTSLSLSPRLQTLQLNDLLVVNGVLSMALAPSSELFDQEIVVTVTGGSKGVQKFYPRTTDNIGNWSLPLNVFTEKATFLITAEFKGITKLTGSRSETATILVEKSAGYAIVIQGKVASGEGLKDHGFTTDNIIAKLKARSFLDENITYLTSSDTSAPSLADIQNAISVWAQDKMNQSPAPLYIIMVDHGSVGKFHIGGDTEATTVTPDGLQNGLKKWLDDLEAGLSTEAAREKRFVIIGACYSGSFIPALSGQGRVIITSAADNEESIRGGKVPLPSGSFVRSGEYFIDELFTQLSRDYSFAESFKKAAKAISSKDTRSKTNGFHAGVWDTLAQHPLLDSDGDHIGSYQLDNTLDGQNVATLKLGAGAVKTNASDNPADIKSTSATEYLQADEKNRSLWLTINQDSRDITAWIEIKKPGVTTTSGGGTGQVIIDLDTASLTRNAAQSRWEFTYTGFFDSGTYEIFYYTQDNLTGDISPMARSVVYKNRAGDNAAPNAFGLISPPDVSVDPAKVKTFLSFQWEPSSDSDGLTYTLIVSTDSQMNNQVYRQEGITDTFLILPDGILQDLTTYYWTVLAVDSFGKMSAANSGQPWIFRTDNNNALPAMIKGYIVDDTGQPVAGATISTNGGQSTSSLSSGAYVLTVSPNNYIVTVNKTGYAVAQAGIATAAGAVSRKDVQLDAIFTLSVTTNGTGTGSVNSDVKGVACSSGSSADCSAGYSRGVPIALTAIPSATSMFDGWSLDCINQTGPCNVNMGGNRNVVATFNLIPRVRINTTPYSSLFSAFVAAINNNVIQAKAETFIEDLSVENGVAITLQGGFNDNTYSSRTGFTTIKGTLFIKNGTLIVDGVVIR